MRNLLFLFVLFITLSAHELFLKTDTYFLQPFEKATLYLYNGTFDESDNIITRDRITDAKVIGPNFTFLPDEDDYSDKGNVTYLDIQGGPAGTYAAGISTRPRVIELSAEDFNDYLLHEGLSDVLTVRKHQGIADRPARERYAKHVKALLQVGDVRSSEYSTAFGYPVEFIPLHNPYTAKSGEKIKFRLLAGGKPLPGYVVRSNVRPASGGTPPAVQQTRTDASGEFEIQLDQPGKWYIATIHMTESDDPKLDYISEWATLTFEVR